MQRREFLAGAAALPLFGTPFRGAFRRCQFSLALEEVINQKARERKVIIPVGALKERVEHNGRVAAVVDHVYADEDVQSELPWWRATIKMIIDWIVENWDTIVAVLVKVAPLFLLLL